MATILALLPEGFEEIELVTPVDILRRAGHEVTVAALGPERTVTGKNNLTLVADALLDDVVATEQDFTLLFLPGGPGVKHLRASATVRDLLASQASANRWVAAICAAPLVLHDAGLLAGRLYTAHPSTSDELTEADANSRVVIDGRIITSRGAGTAVDFGLKLVEILADENSAKKIATSICA